MLPLYKHNPQINAALESHKYKNKYSKSCNVLLIS